jgi:N-acetylneuraminic acid mutarotase
MFLFLFSMGGFEGFKRTTRVYVNTIERYSIEDDQWESFSTDGPQLSSLAACAYENSIFLGGGKNGQWYLDKYSRVIYIYLCFFFLGQK